MTKLYKGTSPLPIIEVGMHLRDGWGRVWRVSSVLDGGITIGLACTNILFEWMPGEQVRTWRLAEDWTTCAI